MFYTVKLNKLLKPIAVIVAIVVLLGAVMKVVDAFFPLKYTEYIEKYSAEYELDSLLVVSLINAESRFDADAVSSKGASGLMQLMQITADWGAEEIGIDNYSYDDICDPELNIRIGCWYLSKLIAQYDGNVDTALAAYNAGSGNVSQWLEDPDKSGDGNSLHTIPFPQTDSYVKKINRSMRVYEVIIKLRGGLNV